MTPTPSPAGDCGDPGETPLSTPTPTPSQPSTTRPTPTPSPQVMVEIPETTPFTRMPCGTCPVIGECVEGGKVSPEACEYFKLWLSGSCGGGGANPLEF